MSTTTQQPRNFQTETSHQSSSAVFKTFKSKKLDKTDEYQLFGILATEGQNSNQGQDALTRLILDNEHLVKSVVKSAIRLFPGGMIFHEDMAQAAQIGLIEAINRFDITKGKRFAIYAKSWIWKYVLEEMATLSSMFSLPDKFYSVRKRLNDAQLELSATDEFGKWIYDPVELANHTKMTTERVESILTAPTINELLMQTNEDGDPEDSIDLLADEKPSTEEKINFILLREKIKQLLLTALSPKDYEIIARHFGFNDFDEQTHEEIARYIGVSTATVRGSLATITDKLPLLFLKNGIALESLFLKVGERNINYKGVI